MVVKAVEDTPQIQPLIEKEGKSTTQPADGGLDNGPIQETRMIRKYSALELLGLGKT